MCTQRIYAFLIENACISCNEANNAPWDQDQKHRDRDHSLRHQDRDRDHQKLVSRRLETESGLETLTSLRAFCVYTPRTRNSPARCFRRQKLNSFQNEHPSFVPLLAAKQPQQLVDDVFVTTSTPVIFCVPLNTRSRCRQYHTFERFDPSKFAPLRSKYIRYPAISQSARTQFIITLLAAQM